MRSLVTGLLAAGLALSAAPCLAQGADSTITDACRAAERRQFDFWMGSWVVTDTAGNTVGANRISRIAGGCGLLEEWRAASGGEGKSINTYRPSTGRWTQHWVDGLGTVLDLSGGLEGGSMVLLGERTTPRGPVVDRVTWTPLADGSVRQVWDISSDGRATWRTIFDGLYRRAP